MAPPPEETRHVRLARAVLDRCEQIIVVPISEWPCASWIRARQIASYHEHPDVAMAEAHNGAAMALASELGTRPLVAHRESRREVAPREPLANPTQLGGKRSARRCSRRTRAW